MIKAILRFVMLLMLSCMIVYAPEIFRSVSAPYSLAAPSRALLRIALCCDTQHSSAMHSLINAYQKQYPHVHLRVAHFSQEQLFAMQPPYPDVVLCSCIPPVPLPSVFSCTQQSESSTAAPALLCAVSRQNTAGGTAEQFAAYIDETIGSDPSPFQN